MSIRLIVAIAASCLVAFPALAQNGQRKLSLHINQPDFVPKTAVGLIVSPNGVEQQKQTEFEMTKRGDLLIKFPIRKKQVGPKVLASAIVLDEAGEQHYTPLTPVLPGHDSVFALPRCEKDTKDFVRRIRPQRRLVEELVGIRKTLKEDKKNKLREELHADLLQKLIKLEESFGLQQSVELSAELGPLDLIDRLSRLRNAINSFEVYKKLERKRQFLAEDE